MIKKNIKMKKTKKNFEKFYAKKILMNKMNNEKGKFYLMKLNDKGGGK